MVSNMRLMRKKKHARSTRKKEHATRLMSRAAFVIERR
jgi:hypothetical protein